VSGQTLHFERFIKTSPAEVYHALTNSTRLREWMCDLATTDPKPNGRIYLAWFPGFYGVGHFTKLNKDKMVAYTWYGRDEPRSTLVTFTLTPEKEGTRLKLSHSELGTGKKWEQVKQNFTHSWNSGLDNLVSVLETGLDQRFVRRPMLGVFLDEFNPEIAQKLGIPVTEGVRLGGVVEGMGAQAAGLQANDILVRMGKVDIRDYGSLGYVIGAHQAGEVVDVEFYRGSEKKILPMKLSGRPLPTIPASPKELANQVAGNYAQDLAALSSAFDGVSEAEASHNPAPGEWNAKEVLAHLIHAERGVHTFIQDIVGGYEPIYDDGANMTVRNIATITSFPTVKDLLAEHERLVKESIAFISLLPESFTQHKSSYWRLGYNVLQPPSHLHSHLAQIKSAIQAARK